MQALRTFDDVERDGLPCLQRFVAFHGDRRVVCEQVATTVIRQNESEALRVVEPFDLTGTHVLHPPHFQISCTSRLATPYDVLRKSGWPASTFFLLSGLEGPVMLEHCR